MLPRNPDSTDILYKPMDKMVGRLNQSSPTSFTLKRQVGQNVKINSMPLNFHDTKQLLANTETKNNNSRAEIRIRSSVLRGSSSETTTIAPRRMKRKIVEYKQIESPTVHGKPISSISTGRNVDESGERKSVTIKQRLEADKINFKTRTNNNLGGEGKQAGIIPNSRCSLRPPLAAQTSVGNLFATKKVSRSELQRIFKDRLQCDNEQKNAQAIQKLKIKEEILRLEQITKRAIDHNLASQKRMIRKQRQSGDKMSDAASVKDLTATVEQEPSFADFNGSDKSAIAFSRNFNSSTKSKKLEKSSAPIFETGPTAVQNQPKRPSPAAIPLMAITAPSSTKQENEKSEFQRRIKKSQNLSKGPDHNLSPDSFTPRIAEFYANQSTIDPRKPRIPKITRENPADPLKMINLVSRNLVRGLHRNSSESVPILPETVEGKHQLMPEVLQPKLKNQIMENEGLTIQESIPTADKPTRTVDIPKSFHFKKPGQTRLRKWYPGLIRPRAKPLIVLQKAVKENDSATSALQRIANQVSEQQAKNQAYFEQVLKGREELDNAVLFYKREVEMLHDRAEKSTDLDRLLDAAVTEHAATRSIVEIEEMFEFPVRRGYEYDRRIRELIGNFTEDSLSIDFDSTHSSTGEHSIEHLTEDYSEIGSIESISQSRIEYHRAEIAKEMASLSAEEEKKEDELSNLMKKPASEGNTLLKDVKISGETIFEREETITMDMLYGMNLMVNRDLNPEINIIQPNPKQLLLLGSDCSAIPDSIPAEIDKAISIPARSLNADGPMNSALEKDTPLFNCDTTMMEEIASVLVKELLRDGASFALSIQTKKQAIVEKLQPKKILKVPGPPKAPKMPFNARVDAELVKLFVNLEKNFIPVTPIPSDCNDAELLAIRLTNEAIADIQSAHQSRFRRLKIPGEPRPLNTSDLLSKATELIQNWRNYTERNGRNFEPKLELEVRTKGREICNADLVDQICQNYVIDKILQVLFADCATVIQKIGQKNDFI